MFSLPSMFFSLSLVFNPKPAIPLPFGASYLNGIEPVDMYSILNETAIVEKGNALIVMSNHAEQVPIPISSVTAFTSFDGGNSFPNQTDMRQMAQAANFPGIDWDSISFQWQSSDPSLTIDKSGVIYGASVLFDALEFISDIGCGAENYFTIAKSLNGVNWFGFKSIEPWTGKFRDRPWITADDKTPNVLWATANLFDSPYCLSQETEGVLKVYRSADGGETWQNHSLVANHQPNLNFIVDDGAAIIPIMQDDALHIYACVSNLTCYFLGEIAAMPVANDYWTFPDQGWNERNNSMPLIATDHAGHMLVAWLDSSMGKIATSYSINGGLTWSAPEFPIPTATEQFFPMISWDTNPVVCAYTTIPWSRVYNIQCGRGKLQPNNTISWPAANKWTTLGSLDFSVLGTGGPGVFLGDYIGYNGNKMAAMTVAPNIFTGSPISRQPRISIFSYNGGCNVSQPNQPFWFLFAPVLVWFLRRVRPVVFGVVLLFSLAAPCQAIVGDCNSDGCVKINELITSVRIALDQEPISSCPSINCNHLGVHIDCLTAAVINSLRFTCSQPTPTTTPKEN